MGEIEAGVVRDDAASSVTWEERSLLQQAAKRMEVCARYGTPGWLAEFTRVHRIAQAVLSDIVSRALE